jgi:hypothetical protein
LDLAGFDFDPLQDDLLEVFACGADSLGKLPDAIAAGDDAALVGAEGYLLASQNTYGPWCLSAELTQEPRDRRRRPRPWPCA